MAILLSRERMLVGQDTFEEEYLSMMKIHGNYLERFRTEKKL